MKKIEDYPDLQKLYERNSIEIKNKIIKLLREEPSNSDGPGWIYGFYSPKDGLQSNNNFWIKIGRTERNPFVRVNEWEGNLIFCIKCSYNYRLERLTHLFLDFARENRIGICNKNNSTNQSLLYVIFNYILKFFGGHNNETIHKEIEWFHFVENINVPSIISQIWELVENIFESEILKSSDDSGIIVRQTFPKININTATEKELMKLPSIGKIMSAKIVEYRLRNLFVSIEEIKCVDPYIEMRYDKIKDKIEI